jgi:hypothetical protein
MMMMVMMMMIIIIISSADNWNLKRSRHHKTCIVFYFYNYEPKITAEDKAVGS